MSTHFDIIVIGFGKGGKTLATKAAGLGKKVALVEKSDRMYGGTCINVGCIPTKKLLEESKFAKFFTNKDEFFKMSISKKEILISALREKNYDMLATNSNIKIYDGIGSFVSKNEVKITKDDKEEIISADFVIINTGSISKKLPYKTTSSNIYTSDELLNLDTLPKHLVIIGAGYIALEFASMFSNFGSKVTIISKNETFMPKEDEDVAKSVFESLKKQGINIVLNAKIKSINNNILQFEENNETKELFADAFLNALGRVANTEELNLDVCDIQKDEFGNIKVNEFLQTSNQHIYAIGDVKGKELFTYISLDDFRIVFNHIFGDKSRSTKNRTPFANTLFLDTPLSQIGINEKKAKELNLSIKVAKLPVIAIPRAKISNENDGFLKAIVDAKEGKILGASFHCMLSQEIINEVAIAMNLGAKYDLFKNQIFTHPSMSEALNDLFSQF